MFENLCNKISIKVNPNSYWHYFTSVLSVVAQLTAAWTLGRGPLSRPRIQRGLAPARSQSTNPTISATCCLGLSPRLSLPPTRHAWSLASDLASQASESRLKTGNGNFIFQVWTLKMCYSFILSQSRLSWFSQSSASLEELSTCELITVALTI